MILQDDHKHKPIGSNGVRELAECLDVDAVPKLANEGDMVAWIERKNAILTHSLVVAERGGRW